MTKKKRDTDETETIPNIIIDGESTSETAEEEKPDLENLRENLSALRNFNGVIGYILKNQESATVDLPDPTKTTEYAMLAFEAIRALKHQTQIFELGKIRNALIECPNLKILITATGDCTISVFMEKTADETQILKEISFQPQHATSSAAP